MSKNSTILTILISVLVLLNLYFLLSGFILGGNNKIAYVRSQELVYNFKGTQEAISKFNEQKQVWQMNQDTLQRNFEKELRVFRTNEKDYNQQQLKSGYERIEALRTQFLQYKEAISKKINEEDEKLMQANLNQINSFIESYAERKGYDIIMGTTLDGNLLYAKEALDITEEVLKEMNVWYEGN